MKKIIGMLFAIILFFPLPLRAEGLYNENLVIVMDCSGSMEGHKIAQAKAALKEVLAYVPATTHIGLLSFGNNSGWKYDLGPRNDARLIQAIDSLSPGGMTPLGQYMKIGADRLLQQKQKQLGYGTYRLLVITDGEAQEPRFVDRYTPQIMARGITLDVIGVFMENRHTLSRLSHSYRQANDTASLKQAISEVLAEIGAQPDDATAAANAFEIISGLKNEAVPGIIAALANSPDSAIDEGDGKLPEQPIVAAAALQRPQSVSPGSTQQTGTTMPPFGIIFGVGAIIGIAFFLFLSKR
ncbi:MAG: VWA domain-containing protein [Candidatus Omnitrophica bacterium]|nr:VWA domain-containing protein [Candidatus Omnitrophota bacterium]